MRGEGGVDGRDHVVLILLVPDVVFLRGCVGVLVHGCEVGHGQQRAVGRRIWVVRDVHAAKGTSAAMATDVVAVHDVAVGEDVSKHAFRSKLAIALYRSGGGFSCLAWCFAYLCEIFAGRALRQWLVRMQEGTGFASLAGTLAIELARYVRGTLVVGGAARAGKAQVTHVCAMPVSVAAHATMRPGWHGHGPVGVGHGGAGVVSEVGRGAVGHTGILLRDGGGRRVELVGERVLLDWWG